MNKHPKQPVPTFFPLIVDSTMLSAIKACPTKAFRNHIQHLSSEESTDLICGGAIAAGMYEARRYFFHLGSSAEDALAAGLETLTEHYGDHTPRAANKSLARTRFALEQYLATFPLDDEEYKPFRTAEGGVTIEYNLMTELPILHPELGVPLLFNGRLDLLCEHAGTMYMVDEKTTSGYLDAKWMSAWKMRDQFTAYCWLADQSGLPELAGLRNILVRGISLPKARSKDYGKIDAFYSDPSTVSVEECPTFRTDHQVAVWEKSMLATFTSFVQSYVKYKADLEDFSHSQAIANNFVANGGSECIAYQKPCFFTEQCMYENADQTVTSLSQYVWRPDLARRQPLTEFLTELGI